MSHRTRRIGLASVLTAALTITLAAPVVAQTEAPESHEGAAREDVSAPEEPGGDVPDDTAGAEDPADTGSDAVSEDAAGTRAEDPAEAEQDADADEQVATAEVEAAQVEGAHVVVNELTNGGPGGYHDNFIELTNLGTVAQDVTGWEVFRCTGTGAAASSPQATLSGTIEPGEIVVLARDHAQSTVDADYRYATSFANNSYGVQLRDSEGTVVDAVGVKDPSVGGRACVEGVHLPNVTDSVLGQSWQRQDDTDDNTDDFILAPRTPGDENTDEPSPDPVRGDLLISEIAYAGGDGAFIELGNYGTGTVALDGVTVWRCNEFGRRFAADQLGGGLTGSLEPGAVLVIDGAFIAGGAGALIADADGAVLDRVGLADGADSACADGRVLPYLALGTDDGESYQRTAATGDNRADFVAAPHSRGELEANEPEPPEEEEEFLSTDGGPNVRVAELTNTGPLGNGDIFFELVNYGNESQDLTGWSVFRCIGTGVRASVPQLSTDQLEGVVLEPGHRLTAGRSDESGPDIVANSDLFFDISFAAQYGLIVFDDAGAPVDRVGSARHDVESYCAAGTPLPGTLNGVDAESWQRVGLSGDAREDFIAAPRTPGRVNTQIPSAPIETGPVLISEVANGGPGGTGDNFVEFTNTSAESVNLQGWLFYRCTGTGRVTDDTLQLTLPDHDLAPGDSFVAARSGDASTVDGADATYGVSFATDGGFGVLLRDPSGVTSDAVGVFDRVDSACTMGQPLANDLDFGTGESWQRVDDTGDNAADFVRAARTPGSHGEVTPIEYVVIEGSDVLITEVTNGGAGGAGDQFVELGNQGEADVDISGWQVHYCTPDGRRVPQAQATVPDGTPLEPGEAWTLVGPDHGAEGDARAADALNAEGYGVLVTDPEGAIVDRVAVYYDDVGVVTNAPLGPCNEGVPLDRRMSTLSYETAWEQDLSYHRVQKTTDSWLDFEPDVRTFGELVVRPYTDPTVPSDGSLDPVEVQRTTRTPIADPSGSEVTDETTQVLEFTAGGDAQVQARGGQVLEIDIDASRAVAGSSAAAPPETFDSDSETEIPLTGAQTDEQSRAFPYQRYELAVGEEVPESFELLWTGSSRERHELQMYVWTEDHWSLVAVDSAQDGEQLTLVGQLSSDVVTDGFVHVLVQDGPRTALPPESDPDQAFANPGEYDFAIGHVTDTQYLVEQNVRSFTEINAWYAANAGARDIAYVMHTGDLIQNWLRGDQEDDRARIEFEQASQIQTILEGAGVPHGVLPGNHDNVWGNSGDLYQEYFPVDRFAGTDYFGGVGPLGSGARYDVLERDGVRLLMLMLPYDAHPSEIDWAEQVIIDHPGHNVIFGTHEYLRPEVDERANPSNGRWTSQGDLFFERLVEPYDNVVLTLSGHLHGVRQRVLQDVGGTPGRTVIETVADYQSYEADGRRDALFLRMFQIDVAGGQVAINAYSPAQDSFEPHLFETRDGWYGPEDDELVLPIDLQYDKRIVSEGLMVLGDAAAVDEPLMLSAGQSGRATFSGLQPQVEYGWYTAAIGDGGQAVDAQIRGASAGSAVGNFATAAVNAVVNEQPRHSAPGTFTAGVTEPTDPEPTEPEPTDPGPTDPEPTDPEPTDPGPTDPGATHPGPTGSDQAGAAPPAGSGTTGSDGAGTGSLGTYGTPAAILALLAMLLIGTGLLLRRHRALRSG